MRAELLLVALAGCGPPDAPEELNALSHFLYAQWNNSTASVMEDGVAKLDKQMQGVDFTGDLDARSFKVTPLSRDDLDGVPWPMARNPGDAIGSCVAHHSPWPMDDQARLIIEPNQLDAEPSAKSYMRRFIDPTDPACFLGQGCATLYTDNDVTRENSALTLAYLLHKNWRWVRLGSDRWAVAARSYIDHGYPGQRDGTALQQSYSEDIFLGQTDGKTIRFQCSWSEQDLGASVDDGITLAILVDAVDRALFAADTVIMNRFHSMN